MNRILTQAEIDLCGQFEAFMASLIKGPVKHVTVARVREFNMVNTYDGIAINHGEGQSVSAQIQSSLDETYAADANKAEALKAKISAMQAELQGLAE